MKELETLIASAKVALKQLDKIIVQNVDLTAIDPEKAKSVVDGKIAAVEQSYILIEKIEELEAQL